MLIDASRLDPDEPVRSQVCVVGAGPAGLTVATELADRGAEVCVLESGGMERSARAQWLNWGNGAGGRPVNLASRVRALGGSTDHWGGNSAPLEPIDFESLDHVPGSGWPLDASDLGAHHDRVAELLGLPSAGFTAEEWRREEPSFAEGELRVGGDEVEPKVVQRRYVHFGRRLEPRLRENDRIRVLLGATALALEPERGGAAIRCLHFAGPGADRHRATADAYVLAAGPENIRLLLESNRSYPPGVGASGESAGRWFMRHPNAVSGTVELAAGLDPSSHVLPLDRPHRDGEGPRVFAGLGLTAEARRGRRALGHTFFLVPRRRGGRRFGLRHLTEQAPNRESALGLSRWRDRFGARRLRAGWSLTELEAHTARQAVSALDAALRDAGLGRASDARAERGRWPGPFARGSHFIGGARMSESPEHGVVDSHCRVHGAGGVFVTGPSAMPTCGSTMVTFTALAIALRTAGAVAAELGLGAEHAAVAGPGAAP